MPDDKQLGVGVERARKAGYTDDEIVSHLADMKKFDLDGARKAGYTTAQILGALVPNQGYEFTGNVTGSGNWTEGIGGAILGGLKGLIPQDPTGGHPLLSKEAWIGTGPKILPNEESGIGKTIAEAKAGYQRGSEPAGAPGLFGQGPIARRGPLMEATASALGAASPVPVSAAHAADLGTRGESGKIVEEFGAPIVTTAAGYGIGTALAGRGSGGVGGRIRTVDEAPLPPKTGGGGAGITAADIANAALHWKTGIPKLGWKILTKGGTAEPYGGVEPSLAKGEMEADIAGREPQARREMQADLAKRAKQESMQRQAYQEMNQDFANRSKQVAAEQAKVDEMARKAHAEMESDLADRADQRAKQDLAATREQMRAKAEMDEEFADRRKEIEKQERATGKMQIQARAEMDADFARRTKELQDKLNEHFANRMKETAADERLKEQHAAALNARRGTAQPKGAPATPPVFPPSATSSATPLGNAPLPATPQGVPARFPTVEMQSSAPVRGAQTPEPPPVPETLAKAAKAPKAAKPSILEAGSTLYKLGEEPIPGNPLHEKIIGMLQTLSGSELRTMASAGDRFAAFVLRNMKRPK